MPTIKKIAEVHGGGNRRGSSEFRRATRSVKVGEEEEGKWFGRRWHKAKRVPNSRHVDNGGLTAPVAEPGVRNSRGICLHIACTWTYPQQRSSAERSI